MIKKIKDYASKELEQIKSEICRGYCKFLGKYSDFDALVEDKCSTCPLNRLWGVGYGYEQTQGKQIHKTDR